MVNRELLEIRSFDFKYPTRLSLLKSYPSIAKKKIKNKKSIQSYHFLYLNSDNKG